VAQQTDLQDLVKQLMAGGSQMERQALLDALRSGQVSSIFEKLQVDRRPTPRPAPTEVRGYRVRLDLRGARPPVWRRLELPGDTTLPRLHDVIQAAMGWSDTHLHRFRTGSDYRSGYFLTHFDLDEGEDGVLEDDIRLDQVVAAKGDQLWYEYDLGDGWDHVIKVETVLDEPPAAAHCTGGRLACPPEDCGGIGGHEELAAWVRSGYDDALLPEVFDNAAHARDWLPLDWQPDYFDVEEANAALAVAVAEPVAVTDEIAELCERMERRGVRLLRDVLGRPLSHGPTDVTAADAVRLTETYAIFLDVIGGGVSLTSAGYLPPAVVEEFAGRSGITGWWIGRANREDLTPPVARVRDTVRALGLVTVRKGRVAPTAAGLRCRQDPQQLWQHIIGRLPLGTKETDRHSGWMALAVVGSGVSAQQWRNEISDLLFALGWRSGTDRHSSPPAHSPTLDVLDELAGAARTGWRVTETDFAVAASARAVIRRG
jgi:hypothetical protein